MLYILLFVSGSIVGYALGFNIGAHPGKVSGQATGWWALIKAHLGMKPTPAPVSPPNVPKP
jgi:hypothetical protein